MKLFEKMSRMQIILVAGSVVLLIFLTLYDVAFTENGSSEQETSGKNEAVNNDEYVKGLEERLKTVLSTVNGVGEVEVMITLKSSAEKVALKDIPVSSDITNEEKEGERRQQTNSKSEESTIYAENGKDKSPYVVKEIEPQIMGVVVVSKGGDDPVIKKEIIDAVQVLFGIEAHMIKVMKQI